MLLSSFNFSSSEGVKSWGDQGCEVVAAPMQSVEDDRAVVARILSPETALVTLSQINPSNDNVASDLAQLLPFLPSQRRNVITFNNIDVLSLTGSDDVLRGLLAQRLKIQDEIVAEMDFSELRADISQTVNRLSVITDFSRKGVFGFRHVAPGQIAAKWHKDGYQEQGIIRGVRGLTVAGVDVALKGDFTTSASQKKGMFTVQKYGSTALGLNVLHKHPDDGCPLHRISASDSEEHRWSYVVDGYKIA